MSAGVETRFLMAMPAVTPTMAGRPISSAFSQSTLPSRPCVAVPTEAVMMIAASEVAVASLAS